MDASRSFRLSRRSNRLRALLRRLAERLRVADRQERSGNPAGELITVVVLLAALSFVAVYWCYRNGSLLYYGDALAHLNIARRVFDSRTPGYDQLGTVWLPLPHLLMLPLVGIDALWRSGLAGAISSAVCFVLGGGFLFAAVRRLSGSAAVGVAALALFALNPNALYLHSIPMTESVWFASLLALVYFSVRFEQTQSVASVIGAGLALLAGTLTRYEAWFIIPFAALYFLLSSKQSRIRNAALFTAIASAGALYWLAYNRWYYSDPLEFYHGPWSAKAIYQRFLDQGMERYRGDGDWKDATLYFSAAARLCAGWGLVALGLAGAVASLMKRWFWPLALLALPPVFYIFSIYSSGTPIFVPHLWPNSWYNTRYGLAALPLLAVGAASLAAMTPARFRTAVAAAIVLVGTGPWLFSGGPESWICWKESQVNSEHRRAWASEAAGYLQASYRAGGVITSFGDLTGIFLDAGIPLRETLHSGNAPDWQRSVVRPDLFLHEEWAVTISGDEVATAIQRANRNGKRYDRVKTIAIRGAPVIEIYRRNNEDSIYQDPRRR